jgi:hypothetical protein
VNLSHGWLDGIDNHLIERPRDALQAHLVELLGNQNGWAVEAPVSPQKYTAIFGDGFLVVRCSLHVRTNTDRKTVDAHLVKKRASLTMF